MKRKSVSQMRIVKGNPDLIAEIAARHGGTFDPIRECWACIEAASLVRAHVVAHTAGGPDEPQNMWLLCSECHKEQPDGASREGQLIWLLNHETHAAKLLRLTREDFEPILNSPRVDEWLATRLRDASKSIVVRVFRYRGNMTRTGHCASLRFELLADYQRWLESAASEPNDSAFVKGYAAGFRAILDPALLDRLGDGARHLRWQPTKPGDACLPRVIIEKLSRKV